MAGCLVLVLPLPTPAEAHLAPRSSKSLRPLRPDAQGLEAATTSVANVGEAAAEALPVQLVLLLPSPVAPCHLSTVESDESDQVVSRTEQAAQG
eukprot:4238-Hanusia_phi.AAC.1